MNITTLCLPIRDAPVREVLLGRKKRGFGQGKVTGFGGKVADGESIADAAIRELSEEAGLIAQTEDLIAGGVITFCFPNAPGWDQRVELFLVRRWSGLPVESDEMAPAWFSIEQLPYERMWQDAPIWLPQTLNGQVLNVMITFAADNETVDRVDPR